MSQNNINTPPRSGEMLNYLMAQCHEPMLNFDALADTLQMLISPAILSRGDRQKAYNHIVDRLQALSEVADDVINNH